jgi:hypothetical protein
MKTCLVLDVLKSSDPPPPMVKFDILTEIKILVSPVPVAGYENVEWTLPHIRVNACHTSGEHESEFKIFSLRMICDYLKIFELQILSRGHFEM